MKGKYQFKHKSTHIPASLKVKVYMKNIARSTTDPEIDSRTWIELGKKIAPLTLVAYLATRWRHLHYLQIWPTVGAINISCKFGHQMAPLALLKNLATRMSHLPQLQIEPP